MALHIDFQYDLFEEKPNELDLVKIEIGRIKESGDKVRKGTYAEINRLKKMCLELEERLEIIERNICK